MPVLVNFLLLFSILLWRMQNRFMFPTFWAEDGSTFYANALQEGFSTLWAPYSGYFHTLPRIFALFGSWAPTPFVPLVFGILSLAYFSYVCAFLASKTFSHVLPGYLDRILLAIAICYSPGTSEVLGNLANLHSIATFYIGLFLLRRFDEKISLIDWLCIVPSIFTSGESVVLIPAFLFRAAMIGKSTSLSQPSKTIKQIVQMPQCFQTLIIVGLLFFQALINAVLSQSATLPPEQQVTLFRALQAWFFGFNNWALFLPLFGFGHLCNWTTNHQIGYWIVTALLWLCLVGAFVRQTNERKLGWFWIFSASLVIPLMSLVRGEPAAGFFASPTFQSIPYGHRYEFILAPYGLLTWALWGSLAKFKNNYKITGLASGATLVMCLALNQSTRLTYLGPYLGPSISLKEIINYYKHPDQAPKEGIQIPNAPNGWGSFKYIYPLNGK